MEKTKRKYPVEKMQKKINLRRQRRKIIICISITKRERERERVTRAAHTSYNKNTEREMAKAT